MNMERPEHNITDRGKRGGEKEVSNIPSYETGNDELN